jgi:hypothetical protein
MKGQIRNQLWGQIGPKISNGIEYQFGSLLRRTLGGPFWVQSVYHIRDEIQESIQYPKRFDDSSSSRGGVGQ